MNDFAISFEWNPKDNTEKEILQLPQKIAQKKNNRTRYSFSAKWSN